MSEHFLKTWPHPFEAVRDGRKTFEVRSSADRDFHEGDTLVLRKWDPEARVCGGFDVGAYRDEDGYSTPAADEADTIRARVTYVLHGGRFGLPEGLCVMSIAVAQRATTKETTDG